jgi:hypothetical protein
MRPRISCPVPSGAKLFKKYVSPKIFSPPRMRKPNLLPGPGPFLPGTSWRLFTGPTRKKLEA